MMKEMLDLREGINRMFNEFYPTTGAGEAEAFPAWGWHPAVDIYDEEDKVVIQAELPGIDKKDISVDVKGRMLTLKGERKSEKEVKEENYYRRERSFGKFERAFTLPGDVDPNKVKADFKEGVLKIEIPKSEEQKPKCIEVR
jgi:HSP20 family protein